jgi:hypothetical protein
MVHRCPNCDEGLALPVLVGFPGPEAWELAERGEVILGGCLLGPVHIDQPMECDSCNWSGLMIDGKIEGNVGFVGLTELAADTNTYMEVIRILTTDELNRIVIEISLGWKWQDPRTRVSKTAEHEQCWQRLEREIAEIHARGHTVEIPNEWPDLTDYEPGSI